MLEDGTSGANFPDIYDILMFEFLDIGQTVDRTYC